MRTVGPALMRTSTKRSQAPLTAVAAPTAAARLAGSVSAIASRILSWYAMLTLFRADPPFRLLPHLGQQLPCALDSRRPVMPHSAALGDLADVRIRHLPQPLQRADETWCDDRQVTEWRS